MILKSFGCSFIYGSELHDTKSHSRPIPSQSTWPALYAKEMGYTYQCYAWPGSGNLQIAERVLNQLATAEPAKYIIGWTWIDRFDYTTLDDKWQTVMPVDTDNKARVYYKDLHSQYRDKLTSLMSIKLVLDSLNQSNTPYLMTYIDELLFETKWHTSPAILKLQEDIKPHMTTFNSLSFLEWSRSNGYPETAAWHPLEEAHRAGADYIIGQKIL